MLRLMAPAFGFRVDGREHLPRSGGVLLVTNHLADVDPPFLATAVLPRQLLYVADAKHFTSRPQSVLLFSLGAFPIRLDEVDTRALRYARTMLERGEVVSIFPEGRATFGDRMLPFLEGMGYLALTPGATVLPAGSGGPSASWMASGRAGGGRCACGSARRWPCPARGRAATAPGR